ncbi:hypothetical protein [Serratia marcescens]|uniref:hypothetical protein n=1 Tax=Serratia marcescens TaxID=615 RepID=UPI0007451684|nr:hypothetical protein [Serratia marcescens]CVF68928.1 Uncharacterised protein [Serratia marcescens]
MDKIREEFEKWWKSEYGAPLSDFNELWCSEGGYCDEDLDRQWEAWQASRAGIVVDVPEVCAFNLCDLVSRDDVIESIRSIGLSIKGE